ncbi:DNA ligase-like domain-containing protein [Flavobacterium hercynium]|uniref:Polynucleotide kinase-phosphatase ligase domain-containing protein n=1 Tax=Flavobacterium hercynium TaxID=387094 RepID=A0A226H356_9FLAO|nr:hypothetical protein [Flavobacterium hercynium]OXA88707.1 hypothetical protein B0A66_14980 [Flavobacterium hercynium]SMP34515.1 PNKP adenylyltransferase domain-containing protein, ligase domain [Flavobacterium hercynium]
MLDFKVRNRIEWFCKNKINDFSPTISPAPKSKSKNEIESIDEAIHYYLEKGVSEFVVQKKYMGSYCTIYLKRNLDETYFISRNGFKMDHIDVEKAINSLKELYAKMLITFPDFETLIIASELLPWKVLGAGLIEKEFTGYHDALKTHNEYLQASGLLEKLESVKSSELFTTYISDKKSLSRKEFSSKHKPHIIRQYEALRTVKIPDIAKQEESLKVFKKQINTFGNEAEIHFKPFTILKIVNTSGEEVLPNSNLTYELVNDDAFLNVEITAQNKEEKLKGIYSFFEKLTEANEEGIMIKPKENYIKNLPPCFKVRNNNYLTMIYGVNFHQDFDHYLEKRNVKKKVEQSINGWEINQKMLQIPYKDLEEENYLMRLLLLKRINNEEIEKTLDPRL